MKPLSIRIKIDQLVERNLTVTVSAEDIERFLLDQTADYFKDIDEGALRIRPTHEQHLDGYGNVDWVFTGYTITGKQTL